VLLSSMTSSKASTNSSETVYIGGSFDVAAKPVIKALPSVCKGRKVDYIIQSTMSYPSRTIVRRASFASILYCVVLRLQLIEGLCYKYKRRSIVGSQVCALDEAMTSSDCKSSFSRIFLAATSQCRMLYG